MFKILIPLPAIDFDPTEAAVSWKILRSHHVTFATPDGKVGIEDKVMMTGEGLGVLGKVLRADKNGRNAMNEMRASKEFNAPIDYEAINVNDYDGLILPGGHAPGMRPYLESKILQEKVAEFFDAEKPVGSICHGTVLAARSISKITGKSVLHGKKLTALPRMSELLAWNLTKSKVGSYYRTYPDTTVEDEVKVALGNPANFSAGPPTVVRDTLNMTWPGFVVVDGNLVTARWPGDVHRFALRFKKLLEKNMNS